MQIGYRLTQGVAWLSETLGWRTYRFEVIFVGLVLLLVRMLTGGFSLEEINAFFSDPSFATFWNDAELRLWLADWLILFGVYYSFVYTTVADRLGELQKYQDQRVGHPEIECYPKLHRSFMIKEAFWFVTFVLLQAWSALIGVIVFLLYPMWRRLWRKHYPRNR